MSKVAHNHSIQEFQVILYVKTNGNVSIPNVVFLSNITQYGSTVYIGIAMVYPH